MDEKEAFLAFKGKRIDENQFAAFIFPTLKRLARVVGFRHGVDPDDLASELWILTREKLVESFDPAFLQSGSTIESFLMGCAKRIASTNGVRSLRTPTEELCVSDIGPDGWESSNADSALSQEFIENIPDPNSESELSDMYRKRMLEEILLRLNGNGCNNQKKCLASSKNGDQVNEEQKIMKTSAVPGVRLVAQARPDIVLPMPPKRAPKAVKLSPDQEELVNIRHKLSYSQELFAKALNIGVPCLASYEYGRTAGVPKTTMDAARGLLSEIGSNDTKEYEDIPMSDILAKWAEQMGIPYTEDLALSKALTVSAATISRWKNNKTRPPLIGKPGRPGEPGKLGLKQLEELVRKFGSGGK